MLYENKLVKTAGETDGVAALWSDSKLLLVNSDNFEKEFVLEGTVASVTDCYLGESVSFKTENGQTRLTLSPYGVFMAQGLELRR